MKLGLLINAGEAPVKNIGDYVQSAAQEQFLEHVDQYVEREALHELQSDEPIKLIMNGWFMRHPENFPPSFAIEPLFVSLHISPKIADRMFTAETISYLKRHEPIGCRDLGTQELLESKGIKAYFSGCLTLTLGLNYHSEEKDDVVYFVDPYYEYACDNSLRGIRLHLKALFLLLRHYGKVRKLMPHFKTEFYSAYYRISPRMNDLVMAASFYETYRKAFADDILLGARFVRHQVAQKDFHSEDEKMACARELLHSYARAALVVTSRIHCGLPCLGMGTPVLFVLSEVLEGSGLRSAGRFGGLLDLFHVLRWTRKGVAGQSPEMQQHLNGKKISRADLADIAQLRAPQKLRDLREGLIASVRQFLKKH